MWRQVTNRWIARRSVWEANAFGTGAAARAHRFLKIRHGPGEIQLDSTRVKCNAPHGVKAVAIQGIRKTSVPGDRTKMVPPAQAVIRGGDHLETAVLGEQFLEVFMEDGKRHTCLQIQETSTQDLDMSMRST